PAAAMRSIMDRRAVVRATCIACAVAGVSCMSDARSMEIHEVNACRARRSTVAHRLLSSRFMRNAVVLAGSLIVAACSGAGEAGEEASTEPDPALPSATLPEGTGGAPSDPAEPGTPGDPPSTPGPTGG